MKFEPTVNAHTDYIRDRLISEQAMEADIEFQQATKAWRKSAARMKYMNNFSWCGRPIIQFPDDVLAIQELVWALRPEFVISTGVAHGGSLILTASIQECLGLGKTIGIDIDIRSHNRVEIEAHPLATRVQLIEGSSTDEITLARVRDIVKGYTCLVILDSDHTHDHVYKELTMYSEFCPIGGYVVVLDTFVEELGSNFEWGDRPWGFGNNPMTAVKAWLPENPNFIIDESFNRRHILTSAPNGFIRRQR